MKLHLVGIVLVCLLGAALLGTGCDNGSSRRNRARVAERLSNRGRDHSDVLIKTIVSTLNRLSGEVVLELAPPRPILDDSKSTDGKEVLATCNVTPAVPEGPYNYLRVPAGNVDFRKLRVRAGDVVRYFVTADQQSRELGIRQQTYLELSVRRLDANDPKNALIVEGGLNGPVLIPERVEIWRFSDKRMNEIRVRLTRYVKQRKPALAWEPSPDETALLQLIDRLNQWLRSLPARKVNEQQANTLLKGLPRQLRESKLLAPLVSPKALQKDSFQTYEGRELQQAIWLRDISNWARPEGLSEVEVATALLDWTVRNIQLDTPDTAAIVHRPWQVLMYGHGTAEQRAWVFAELCRQQQLDVVMLGLGADESAATKGDSRWWLPALLNDGQLYLFDTKLGMPIPGGKPGQVATLADVVADPTLLENLNLETKLSYPVTAANLAHVEAWLVASPLQLSRRAALLQQALEGEGFIVLSADPQPIAKKLAANPRISEVRLWPLPWESVLHERTMQPVDRLAAAQRFLVFAQRPKLWKARVLHFQGTKEVPFEQRDDPLAEPEYGHREATKLYHDRNIRPPDTELNRFEPARQVIYRTAKVDASYWLGLLSYDRGKYEVAADWLRKRTLEATPEGPWTAGARYNLARTYEALGEYDKAIKLLEADDSPQRHGNLLRARQLRQQGEVE